MIRKLDILYVTAFVAAFLSVSGCEKYSPPSLEIIAQQKEEQRLQDQKDRTAMVERMKAAALVQDQKLEPIRNLQKQIDALAVQISAARSRGKDCRALEKTQEALETQKYEMQR